MSIYGPPTPPPGRRSAHPTRPSPPRPDARAGLKVLLVIVGGTLLLGVAVAALLHYQMRIEMTREVRNLEEAHRAGRRALEAAGLETAERLPPFERPRVDPQPVQAAELLSPPAGGRADEDPPARLQTAEILH